VPRRDRGGVGRGLDGRIVAVRIGPALLARVLGPRPVDAERPDRLARPVDEVVAVDRDRERDGWVRAGERTSAPAATATANASAAPASAAAAATAIARVIRFRIREWYRPRDAVFAISARRRGRLDLHPTHGAWRSLVARLLWEQEVPGSNPGAPTLNHLQNESFCDLDCESFAV
jgi:hypothetical protein